ncbi:hypothetical protein TELCIR_16982 [Teladorsagia circumcincta]|uniref:Uncharacterized protein n=1 Tax=Teladorsagia circumcincta TaxID=45464 RepID=A0A2G9TU37_TELCI|nr:hypothetical protein TELCIR_16982 [Teladorsagia circumcincta]
MYSFLIILCCVASVCTSQPDLKANLVADHSRKTFRPAAHDDALAAILADIQQSKPVDKGEVDEPLQKFTNNFMASAREQLEDGEDENVFKTLWYDPNYKVHDLCEKSNSDAYIEQIVNLTWHVAPPYFPVGSNEEIKLNDMAITRTRYEKCAGPYPMFRGSGKAGPGGN